MNIDTSSINKPLFNSNEIKEITRWKGKNISSEKPTNSWWTHLGASKSDRKSALGKIENFIKQLEGQVAQGQIEDWPQERVKEVQHALKALSKSQTTNTKSTALERRLQNIISEFEGGLSEGLESIGNLLHEVNKTHGKLNKINKDYPTSLIRQLTDMYREINKLYSTCKDLSRNLIGKANPKIASELRLAVGELQTNFIKTCNRVIKEYRADLKQNPGSNAIQQAIAECEKVKNLARVDAGGLLD
jgi:uncharacterized coiled-coil DUF342 family protein